MLYGANLAGRAINISKTTVPHAVSYPFTSNYGISHGHAVSLTFEKFFKFNYFNKHKSSANFDLQKRFDIIFDLTKSKNINSFCDYIIRLKRKAKLENNFNKLGININKEINKITSNVNTQRLKNNPIELNKKDLNNIILEKLLF
jgi:alcohol dehydrogenase class IV